MSSPKYSANAYDNLTDARARQLYDWLIRYHQQHGGRRASRAEMRKALNLSREPLNDLISTLEHFDLFVVETDDRGQHRSYQLPGERWHHPHLSKLELSQVFYPSTLFDTQ